MKRTINFVAAAVLVFGATAAFGQASSSNTDNVTATVSASCTVGTFDLAFNAYDPFSATPTDANTSISVTCTAGTSPTISLSAGRTMAGTPSGTLTYSLWSDAYTTAWTDGATIGPSTSISTPISVPLYGRLAAGQDVPVGSYAGTLNATVNY